VRCAGDDFAGGAAHLLQLQHEVFLGLQAAGGIDDDVIHLAAWRGDGVEETALGSLPCSGESLAYRCARPDLQLLDGGGAEGIGGTEEDGALFVLEAAGEFADGGGFTAAVDAHHEHDGGRIGDVRRGAFAGLEDFEEVFADEVLQLGGVGELAAVDALADAFQNFAGGAHADIGGDEGGLQLIEEIGIDLLLALQGVFERGDQSGARLLDAALEFFQEAGSCSTAPNRV